MNYTKNYAGTLPKASAWQTYLDRKIELKFWLTKEISGYYLVVNMKSPIALGSINIEVTYYWDEGSITGQHYSIRSGISHLAVDSDYNYEKVRVRVFLGEGRTEEMIFAFDIPALEVSLKAAA